MQWLDEKYVTSAELIRREQRDQWESENFKESKDRGRPGQLPRQCSNQWFNVTSISIFKHFK
jgi:hypothetical protein